MTTPNPYIPHPVDTSGVTLPDDITELTELLARNAHDTWAQGRMAEGWSYGPQRDDRMRRHPDLVPYDELSETEKDYDRHTALDTLRLIICLGYDIVKR